VSDFEKLVKLKNNPLIEAKTLQRPLPDDALQIVARGEKQDGGGK
jgi:hypothetical protein